MSLKETRSAIRQVVRASEIFLDKKSVFSQKEKHDLVRSAVALLCSTKIEDATKDDILLLLKSLASVNYSINAMVERYYDVRSKK